MGLSLNEMGLMIYENMFQPKKKRSNKKVQVMVVQYINLTAIQRPSTMQKYAASRKVLRPQLSKFGQKSWSLVKSILFI